MASRTGVSSTRPTWQAEPVEAAVYRREELVPGNAVDGPAIVEEMDSTTVILPGYSAKVDAVGNLLINPQA